MSATLAPRFLGEHGGRPGAVALLRRCGRGRHVPTLDLDLDRFEVVRVDIELLGHAAGERGELERLAEADQRLGFGLGDGELVEHLLDGDVLVEPHEVAADARLVGELDQVLAPLVLLDLGGAFEQRVEVAIFPDQLGAGLDADAGDARHVVDAVAGKRLDLDHLVRPDAELLDHFGLADRLVLHGVEHHDLGRDELHQVLVGGDDGDPGAGLGGLAGIGRDQVVGLEALHLDRGQVEGAHRLADQAELGH